MKFFIYILTLLIFPILVSAQVPGYQGKRFSVDGDFFFMSALFNPTQNSETVIPDQRNIDNGTGSYYNNYGTTSGSFTYVHPENFNTRYNLNLSYILTKDISMELTGGMFTTGWNHQFKESRSVMDPYYGGYTSVTYEYSDLYKVQGKMVGVNFKFFRKSKGAIAPNGSYFKLGTSYIMNTPTYLGAYENTGYGNSKERATSSSMVLFTCGLGKQTIFYNRLIFRYGIEFGMSPTVLTRITDGILATTGDSDGTSELGYTMNERVLLQNLVNINLGLGFILF
jgi:hypothetical protein